jgi:putative DNA primase/helicase
VREVLELPVPPREFILEPILQNRQTAMVYAWRGTGKTYFNLSLAYAIASGATTLHGWKAPAPRRVLYIDGEMPIETLKERLATITHGADREPPEDNYLSFIPADTQTEPLPNLALPEGQAAFASAINAADVIFVDSISTLCNSGKADNDVDSWLSQQNWALDLRRAGKTVVFIHHAGKGGQQRGTSRREDILDLSINLKQPNDYMPDQGARFEVHFTKARGLLGEAVKPFEAQLIVRDNRAEWQTKDLEDALLNRVVELHNNGITERDAAEELKISKSKLHRLKERAKRDGLIEFDKAARERWNRHDDKNDE